MGNKKWMKTSALTMVAVGMLLAGCSGGNNAPQNSGNQSNASKEPDAEQLAGHLITKEPLELTLHMHFADRFIYDDNWPIFKEAEKMTNIKLKGTASKSATNSAELFNTMMASGKVPDLVHHQNKEQYDSLGMEGAFLELDELIEEHAPNIKKFLSEHPDSAKYMKASNGKTYFLNFTPDGPAAKGWFVRQDWLDKLNLEQPKTVDELYAVLKAFKEKDPNGNGANDEVPFFSRDKLSGIYDLLIQWGVQGGADAAKRGFYADNGVVKYGMYEQGYKTAIENIAKWYKEGLIDKEIFTRGPKARDILLGDNVGGMTHDWFASTANFNDILAPKIAGFFLNPIAPPANTEGKILEESSRKGTHASGWGISAETKHPVEAIKYMDFWFSEDGRRLMNFGIEGKHYDLVDGKPKFKDSVLKNTEKTVIQQLQEEGGQIELAFHQDYAYEEQWTNPIALKGIKDYVSNGYIMEAYPPVSYTDEERNRFEELNSAVLTFVEEKLQKWVLGAEPINDETFSKYIKQLEDLGIKELLELEQGAYDRYMK
ncbi:extracellular solute-binding protein [Paenibacillus soyae]|uniref:Extracellular solute-binding protein n=1 Tax=Paenibacillus soyae TaxID=2969249 RepID=A0A9X2MX70_9BACL|nr:extracellular solute-binding protein [Paenibacillus soyae]